MDKKLFGSILIVLVLISCLWVFAYGYSSEDTIDAANYTSNGTVVNWSSFYTNTVDAPNNFTVNFSINPNFAEAGTDNIYNITNISIALDTDLVGYFNISLDEALWGPANNTAVFNGSAGILASSALEDEFACTVTGGIHTGIQCINETMIAGGGGHSNISGNATIAVWFWLGQNKSTGAEAIYDFTVYAVANTSAVSDSKTMSFGVDDLAPRIKSLNISDGNNVRQSKDGDLNFTKDNTANTGRFLNKTDLIVTMILTEYNRDTVQILWGWNGSTALIRNAQGLGHDGNGTMTNVTCSTSTVDTGTQECLYNFTIKSDNLTAGNDYSIIIWTNDSFDQQSNFTNGGAGYNFTIDHANVTVRKLELSKTSLFATNPITVTCMPKNFTSGTYSTAAITITKPSGKTVAKTVDTSVGWKHIFSASDTNEAGLYKADCIITSPIGNRGTAGQETFRVFFSDTSTGEPVGEEPVAKVDISTVEEPSGTISVKQGQSSTFTIDGVTAHTITFLEVGITSAKIRIESEPIEFTLNVGEYRNVDLTGDGVDDIKVTLTEIDANGLAKVDVINLVKLEEQRTGVSPELPGVEAKGRVGLWMTILIILIIIGVGYYLLKGKKGKKGEVKFSKQDLGL